MGLRRRPSDRLVKVAYYSPFPPERSGIADYSALLFPALEERMDITAVRRGAKRPPRRVDVSLYHIGNNPEAHGWILDALRRRSGVVVLHDFVLHHLIAGVTIGEGHPGHYLDAMQREAGVVGRMLAHGVVDNLLPPIWEYRAHDFPLTGEVLRHADGLICHSHYVEQRAREYGYARPISVIPMPAWPSVEVGSRRATQGSPVFACIGYLNAAKRIPQLLQALTRVRVRFPDAVLVLAGAAAPDVDVDPQRLGDGVHRLDHLDEQELWQLLADCDICIGLRGPTMGETSGMAIRALSLGRPLVVSDVGWFSELPDSVAAKVPLDEDEVDVLTATLERLAEDDELRGRMGTAAREFARREHDLARVADRYVAALEELLGGPAVQDTILGEVAHAAQEVAMDKNDPQLAEIAASLQEVGFGH
jgi:glycosyltransferase involved in cell wall biosynthesis